MFLKQLEGWNPFIEDTLASTNGHTRPNDSNEKSNQYSVRFEYNLKLYILYILLGICDVLTSISHDLNSLQVFYGATTDSNSLVVFWVINKEVNLSRIRYQLPGDKCRVSIIVLFFASNAISLLAQTFPNILLNLAYFLK